jgi:hypothetical protein
VLNRTLLLLGALAAFAGAAPCAAQVPAAMDTTLGDTLLVEQPLHGPSDSLRIRLTKGSQYRVALWPADARLSAYSQDGRTTAFTPRTREGTATRPTVVELYPPATAEYLIVIASSTATTGGRVEIWSDRKLAAAHKEARDRDWGIGLGLMGEVYSAYSTIDGYPPEGGTGLGGCLLIGSSGPLSGCLGFDNQPRSGEAGSLTWYFIEPRFRFLTAHAFSRPFDLLATFRIGQGHQDRLGVDPSMLAPGILLAYHLDDHPGARGLRLVLQVYGALLGNTDLAQKPSYVSGSLGLNWIP